LKRVHANESGAGTMAARTVMAGQQRIATIAMSGGPWIRAFNTPWRPRLNWGLSSCSGQHPREEICNAARIGKKNPRILFNLGPMSDSFAEFVTRLHSGDDQAARQLFERFAQRLIGMARRRFDGPLRNKVDPEDVVQSAYKSFFSRHADGNVVVGNWNSMWGLLTIITVRKCAERVAYHRAQQRDLAREIAPPTDSAPAIEALSREPTPAEAVELTETVSRLMAGLDASERPVLELSLQGYSTREISEQLNRAERTVRLLRERVRKRLERMQQEDQ
jgi:RNA polymerase sigma-70 factor, ECF subfamily